MLIAEHYAPLITLPIKYGENGAFFWFPRSGMSTTIREIFSNKAILKQFLSGLSSRLTIIQFWGPTSDKKTAASLLSASGYSQLSNLHQVVSHTLDSGKEVVLILAHIDDFPSQEKKQLFRQFLRLNAINPRRVHILYFSFDKPWFESLITKNPEFMTLAQNLEVVPLLKGQLLNQYITDRASHFGLPITAKLRSYLATTYGGILQITKQYLRLPHNTTNLELKLRSLWLALPNTYRIVIETSMTKKQITSTPAVQDLSKFGVLPLKLFSKHWSVLVHDPSQILPHLLTPEENSLLEHIRQNPNKEISRESVISLLRPNSHENTTDWALDQTISRLRKKLARAGIDPDQLKTLKGRGYIWKT